MHELSYLPSVLVMLCTSIFVSVVMKRIHLSPVLGYLIMGTVVGQYGLRLVQDNEYTLVLAEFGVVFLLFVIGLELTFDRLIKMRTYVFGFGSIQIVATTILLGYFILKVFKLSFPVSFVLSSALSLSSTAIVLQILNEKKKNQTKVGKLSLATLLMQDFAVVPLLSIIPIIAGSGKDLSSTIGFAVLKALIAIVAITVVGRLFLRPFFSLITSAKTDAIYVTTSLLIVLGASWITNQMKLSSAMGAFLAGLLIAETEYRNKIEYSIMPFQELFLSLFFLTVGMSIDLSYITHNIDKILLLSAIILAVKILVLFGLCKAFKFQNGAAIHASLLLSQVGEFAFILLGLLGKYQIIEVELQQLFLMSVAFTMAITPLLQIVGQYIEDKIDNKAATSDLTAKTREFEHFKNHVIIAGFGRIGRIVAYMLAQEQIEYIAIDYNQSLASKSKKDGFEVYMGDVCNREALEEVNIANASSLVICLSDKFVSAKLTKMMSTDYKNVNVIVRVDDYRDAKLFEKLGASVTVPTIIETGIQIGAELLGQISSSESNIANIKKHLRHGNYKIIEEVGLFKGMLWDK